MKYWKGCILMLLLIIFIMIFPHQVFAGSLGAQLVIDEKVVTSTAKALPTGGDANQTAIFTITGGPIEILSLTGEVTTIIESKSIDIIIRADPTTPATDTDLCAQLEINGDAVGTFYSLKTSFATALQEATNGADEGMGYTIIVPVGAIDIRALIHPVGSGATATGNITWRMRYRPLHHGVTVTAN